MSQDYQKSDRPKLTSTKLFHAKEPLIYSSHRRKPVSSALNFLDSGFRRNDESAINQHLPKSLPLPE